MPGEAQRRPARSPRPVGHASSPVTLLPGQPWLRPRTHPAHEPRVLQNSNFLLRPRHKVSANLSRDPWQRGGRAAAALQRLAGHGWRGRAGCPSRKDRRPNPTAELSPLTAEGRGETNQYRLAATGRDEDVCCTGRPSVLAAPRPAPQRRGGAGRRDAVCVMQGDR